MHLSQRIFRKQLRVNAGGADPAAEHGSSRRDPSEEHHSWSRSSIIFSFCPVVVLCMINLANLCLSCLRIFIFVSSHFYDFFLSILAARRASIVLVLRSAWTKMNVCGPSFAKMAEPA